MSSAERADVPIYDSLIAERGDVPAEVERVADQVKQQAADALEWAPPGEDDDGQDDVHPAS